MTWSIPALGRKFGLRLNSLHAFVACLLLFGVAWLALITGSAAHVTWLDWKLDYSQSGVFGDSFGGFSAIMAASAAYFTFCAFRSQRRSTRRLEVAERRRLKAERDRDAEQTLFRLMDLRNDVIQQISIDIGLSGYSGLAALSKISDVLSKKLAAKPGEADKIYAKHYEKWRDELGHYFRLTYHIVRFADVNFDPWKAYQYIRLLRAQLSNSEQILIALTCAYGEGRSTFKGWVENYALLHNIHPSDRTALLLDLLFEPSAFDRVGAIEPSGEFDHLASAFGLATPDTSVRN
ncbi:putative phage abortive infection protein [Brevundimonas vesicularis]|uniref:putative phage abortive infection protein n=1 Tax=Brevundimonas vesicularis TaxID=41276 RepID=UPI00384CEA3E